MHTSYDLRGAIRHPAMGAWLNVFQGGGNSTLPNFVSSATTATSLPLRLFPAQFSPLYVNNPENGLKNVKLQPGLTEDRFVKRMNLADELDQDFRNAFQHRNVKAYSDMYDNAMSMMKSEDLKAFDLTEEPEDLRKAYGKEAFGQGCLLARRLVERGVRFVEVSLERLGYPCGQLCACLNSATSGQGPRPPVRDLNSRGLLKDTLVVLTSEFGRTPDINQNVGRDHYPKAFSAVWPGAVSSPGV